MSWEIMKNHENAVAYTGRNFEGFPYLLGLGDII